MSSYSFIKKSRITFNITFRIFFIFFTNLLYFAFSFVSNDIQAEKYLIDNLLFMVFLHSFFGSEVFILFFLIDPQCTRFFLHWAFSETQVPAVLFGSSIENQNSESKESNHAHHLCFFGSNINTPGT